ncbi:hypothetical protein B0H17DRAFT_1195703 [Mycena rosella]|uniref:Uncharacterized protein n=1 Tax=Mycena rosella TaxID=1033263 RepID=A0AAD7DVR1_MYCRO|nr:hypothetical protein B0H17DRAFT_1195703 [Mycena rosella]
MRDPYWAGIHASLEAYRNRVDSDRTGPVEPGELATTPLRRPLRNVFYESIQLHGYQLRDEELREIQRLDNIAADLTDRGRPAMARPCLVLERHGPGLYLVCFLATMQYRDTTLSPALSEMSIPFGNNQVGGLRMCPEFHSRLMLATPVIRSDLVPWGSEMISPRTGKRLKLQLDYGELERARKLVREKLAHFKANSETIRAAELVTSADPTHDSNKRIGDLNINTVKTEIAKIPSPVIIDGIFRQKDFYRPLRVFNYIEPHRERHSLRWFMKPERTEIVDASRYLSSLVDPPSPPFRMPPPFFSRSLRASAAFVRRRITPLW